MNQRLILLTNGPLEKTGGEMRDGLPNNRAGIGVVLHGKLFGHDASNPHELQVPYQIRLSACRRTLDKLVDQLLQHVTLFSRHAHSRNSSAVVDNDGGQNDHPDKQDDDQPLARGAPKKLGVGLPPVRQNQLEINGRIQHERLRPVPQNSFDYRAIIRRTVNSGLVLIMYFAVVSEILPSGDASFSLTQAIRL